METYVDLLYVKSTIIILLIMYDIIRSTTALYLNIEWVRLFFFL